MRYGGRDAKVFGEKVDVRGEEEGYEREGICAIHCVENKPQAVAVAAIFVLTEPMPTA